MRVFGMTVGRNEAHRYLVPMLEYARGVVDEHFFFDDCSTDETAEIASDYGCTLATREIGPSFNQCEALFRQTAWRVFEERVRPEPGDWVLVIDCDEVLTPRALDIDSAETLRALARSAGGVNGIILDIPEVFGIDVDGCPLIRRDKLWGTIRGPRLVPYRPGGKWDPRGFGAPGQPHYALQGPYGVAPTLALLHFGYARAEDRQAKYVRYHADPGHGSAHVESILDDFPVLERWPYAPYPEMCSDLGGK